jgi:VanZ family protein
MIKNLLENHSYKLSAIWALVIFGLCSMPGNYIPSVSWLELLSFDKWVHSGVFFILLSLLGFAVKSHQQKNNLFVFYFFLCVLYGGALEIMQARVFSDRSADWYDAIANSFGCLIALFLNNKLSKLVFK